jgi:hypothetical protein
VVEPLAGGEGGRRPHSNSSRWISRRRGTRAPDRTELSVEPMAVEEPTPREWRQKSSSVPVRCPRPSSRSTWARRSSCRGDAARNGGARKRFVCARHARFHAGCPYAHELVAHHRIRSACRSRLFAGEVAHRRDGAAEAFDARRMSVTRDAVDGLTAMVDIDSRKRLALPARRT